MLRHWGFWGLGRAEQGRRSGWPHFKSDGLPVWGPPHGFGLMQVELNPGATLDSDQLGKMFNWKLNVAEAKRLNTIKATQSQNFYWDSWIQWLVFAQANGGPSTPTLYTESTPSRVEQCTFADPSQVGGILDARSYIDGITIKKYNGAELNYLHWVNSPLRGIGWAVAAYQRTNLPLPTGPRCNKYVKKACTLSTEETSFPLVNGACDIPYNYEWVSTF